MTSTILWPILRMAALAPLLPVSFACEQETAPVDTIPELHLLNQRQGVRRCPP